jgi:ubiquinone/menaquinone biosynthesis C-methylase UbiE
MLLRRIPINGVHQKVVCLSHCSLSLRPTIHHRAACTAYDKAIYEDACNFGEKIYWDQRYQDEKALAGKENFEWYRSFESLRGILLSHFSPTDPLLHVGVGSSLLQESLVEEDGFSQIVNTDFSPVCIEKMRLIHLHLPQLSYELDDVRSMRFDDASFSGCLDKGTLDALLCGYDADEDARRMMGEVLRVLRPKGQYLCITSQAPKERLRYLLLTPPECAYSFSKVDVYEVGQHLKVEGPYRIYEQGEGAIKGNVSSLPKMPYSHFVYACKKE